MTSINGRLVNPRDAKISVFDNSVMYGEGLFEMFLGIDDRVIFEEEHLRRLYRGAKVIDLKMPIPREELRRWMRRTLAAHPARIKKLRLTVTCGLSKKWFGEQGKPQIILNAGPHVMPEDPYRLYLAKFRLDERSEFRRIKTLSYTIHAVALKRAQARRYDDALLLNNRNQVAEVTSANIFWLRQGKIYTPPLSSGCLDGVTRRIVFREVRKLGYTIEERNITLPKMLETGEIFISSSTKLVIPVSRIRDEHTTHELPVGPVSRELSAHFRRLVGLD